MNIVSSGLCLFSRVGNNYGVIDLDDGRIDWVSKEDLIKFAKEVEIVGVDTVGKHIAPVNCRLNMDKCVWTSNNTNIFVAAKSIFFNKDYNNGELTVITNDNKKFKGKVKTVCMQGDNYRVVTFYGHIIVFFDTNQFDALIAKAV